MPLDQARWQLDIVAADKTAQAFTSVDRRMQMLAQSSRNTATVSAAGFTALQRTLAPIAAALAAAASAHRVWTAGMKAANLGEEAEQIGVTTDQLQAYRFAAAQANVTNEQLDASVMRLTRAMGEANSGNDEMIARFDRLGVKLLDNEGKLRRVGAVLPELARGLLSVTSETERNSLMMELMGRSGSRMVPVLQSLAQGNEALVESAKSLGAIISPENAARWDKLGDALSRAGANTDALIATLTAPAAEAAADLMMRLAKNTERATIALNALPADATLWQRLEAIFGKDNNNTMGGLRLSTPAEKAMDELAAAQKRLQELEAKRGDNKGAAPALDAVIEDQRRRVAQLEASYRAAAKEAENAAAMQRLLNDGLPARDGAAASGGKGQPTGKQAAKAGSDLAKRRLEESKKQLDEMLNGFEKIRQASEGVMDRFGNGVDFATREMAELNEMLQLGYIDAQTFNVAAIDIARRAEDMDRAFRGAQGGADAFIAGIEQAMSTMSRANSAFEIGQEIFTTSIDLMSQAITDFVTKGELDFNRLLGSFVNMLAQMALQEAASGLAKTGISILGGFLGGGGIVAGSGMTFADGGRPPTGRPSVVGENGWELFVPDRPGTIYNQEQLAAMAGSGGPAIHIHQNIQVGSFATRAEMLQMGQVIERSAREGAAAEVSNRLRRNDVTMRVR